MDNKIILRILLSPFILIWGLLFTAAMWLFPMFFIAGISFVGIVSQPFIYLFKLSGSEIEYVEPFFPLDYTDFKWLNRWLTHLAFFLLTFWLPFYIMLLYIKTGEIFDGE